MSRKPLDQGANFNEQVAMDEPNPPPQPPPPFRSIVLPPIFGSIHQSAPNDVEFPEVFQGRQIAPGQSPNNVDLAAAIELLSHIETTLQMQLELIRSVRARLGGMR
jgi:hypothetical protein